MDNTLDKSTSKYKALRDWIIEAIESGRFAHGTVLPSENMLCDKFTVSRQTVRNAMAELKAEGYVERHKGKGTFVKKRTRLSRDKSIGVILGFLDNYIFPSVLEGIERTLTRNGYGIDLGFGHNRVNNEAKFLHRIIESNVSGVIVEGVKSAFPNPNAHLYNKLLSEGVPVVLVHNYYTNIDCPAVVMDDTELTRQITQMVIDAGHRRIAGLFKFDDIQGPHRYAGFIQALMENDIPVREEHIRWYDSMEMKESALRNRRLYEEFAEDVGKNCTAMVCYNDLVACAVISYLREKGYRVPEDVSVAGFDDSDIMKQYDVSLTSVHHPKDKMGEMAAEVLLEYIRDPKKNIVEKDLRVIPAGITVRDSIRVIHDPVAQTAVTD